VPSRPPGVVLVPAELLRLKLGEDVHRRIVDHEKPCSDTTRAMQAAERSCPARRAFRAAGSETGRSGIFGVAQANVVNKLHVLPGEGLPRGVYQSRLNWSKDCSPNPAEDSSGSAPGCTGP
jgi:hypothetical protein